MSKTNTILAKEITKLRFDNDKLRQKCKDLTEQVEEFQEKESCSSKSSNEPEVVP